MDYLTNRERGTAGGFSSPSVTLLCLDKVERRQEVECSSQSREVQGTQRASHEDYPPLYSHTH